MLQSSYPSAIGGVSQARPNKRLELAGPSSASAAAEIDIL